MRKTGKNELIALLAVAGVVTAGAAQAANPSHDASKASAALKVVDHSRTTVSDGRDGACSPGKCGNMEGPAKKAHEKKAHEAREKKVEEKKETKKEEKREEKKEAKKAEEKKEKTAPAAKKESKAEKTEKKAK